MFSVTVTQRYSFRLAATKIGYGLKVELILWIISINNNNHIFEIHYANTANSCRFFRFEYSLAWRIKACKRFSIDASD
jgi:hypothetical protein